MGTYLLMCDEWEQCIVVSAYLPHNFCRQYLFFIHLEYSFTCMHLYCYSWTMSLRQLLIIIDLNFHLCIGMQGICYYDWSELKQSKGNKDLAVITTLLWWHYFVLFLFYMVGIPHLLSIIEWKTILICHCKVMIWLQDSINWQRLCLQLTACCPVIANTQCPPILKELHSTVGPLANVGKCLPLHVCN